MKQILHTVSNHLGESGLLEILRIPRSLEPDPCQSLPSISKEPKKENRLPRVYSLTEDEVRKIFDQPNLDKGRDKNRTALEVFYFHQNKT